MNLFKSFTLTWWQAALYKVGMLAFGIVVGTYWHELFASYLLPLIVVAMVSLAYVSYLWWKQ